MINKIIQTIKDIWEITFMGWLGLDDKWSPSQEEIDQQLSLSDLNETLNKKMKKIVKVRYRAEPVFSKCCGEPIEKWSDVPGMGICPQCNKTCVTISICMEREVELEYGNNETSSK